jgi:hypothetical protein
MVVVFDCGEHALEFGAHFQPQQRVEVRQRLVHQDDVRLHGERAGDGDALALAAGQLAGIALQQLLDMHEFGGAGDAALDVSLRQFLHAQPKAMFSNTVRCGKTA